MRDNLYYYANYNIKKCNGEAYCEEIHYRYLVEFAKNWDKIILISNASLFNGQDSELKRKKRLSEIKNLELLELPYFSGYYEGFIKNFFYISKFRKSIHKNNCFFSRAPEPCEIIFASFFDKSIIHFVSEFPLSVYKLKGKKYLVITFVMSAYYFLWLRFSKKIKATSNGSAVKRALKIIGVNSCSVQESPLYAEEYMQALDKEEVNKKFDSNKIIWVGRKDKLPELKKIFIKLSGQIAISNLLVEVVGVGKNDFMKQFADVKGDFIVSGWVSYQEVLEKIKSSKLVLFASQTEGSPRVCLESLAVITPFVGYDSGNIRDLIRSDSYIVDEGDVNALTDKLVQFLSLTKEEYFSYVENITKGRNLYTINSYVRNIRGIFDYNGL